MPSTVSALDRHVVGANLQELCNKVSDLTGAAITDIEALQSSVSSQKSDVSGLTCLSGDAVGDAVYISAANTVAKADADDTSKIPAVGLIVSKQSSTSCTVRFSGLVTGLTSLTAGSVYYLSTTAGSITATAPSAPNATPVGVAVSTTTLFVFGSLGTAFSILRAKGLLNATKCIPINLGDWREVDANGDVANTAGGGGVLSSNTTPILRGDTNNSWEISWATGNVDPIGISLSLPGDLDDTASVSLELDVYSGTTNAATMGVASSWNGGSEVTDSADDSGTKSASAHTITATIDASDVPASSKRVTFRLTPPTHATDAIQLVGARVYYTPKAA